MIYLDYNATTPLDPRVLEAFLPFYRDQCGNAASRPHRFGKEASDAVEKAREQAASLIGAQPDEIVWTSGATESVNLALKGVAKRHVITVATEHRAVLDVCDQLEAAGIQVTVLGVDGRGRLDLARLEAAITAQPTLVSIMHANNETGVLHPLAEIGALCRRKGAIFHTDATQTFGKEAIDVDALSIDLLSASAHKFCGPKGAGILYVRKRGPRVKCEPIFHGGGHERGFRSGTLNVPGIVGFGAAAALAAAERATEQPRFRALRDRLEMRLVASLGAVVNGDPDRRLAHTSNLSFPGVDGDALMKSLSEVAVSSSSACTSAQMQPSYVLGALGCDDDRIRGSIRFSLGRFTTEAEIDAAADAVVREASRLRKR